jgi:hypothetical protein
MMTGAIRPDRDTPDSIRIYIQMIDYGRCASGLGKKTAFALFSGPANTAVEIKRLADLQDRLRACISNGSMPPILSLQRGVLAEGVYHRVVKDGAGWAGWTQTDPRYAAFMADQNAYLALVPVEDQAMYAATDCLAAQQPALIDKVLSSTHGSPAEAQEMDALFAAAPNCAGSTRPATLGRSFLRAFLATSAFRLTAWRAAKQ